MATRCLDQLLTALFFGPLRTYVPLRRNEANFTISQIPSALAKDLGWSFQRDDSREVVKVLEADRKAGLVCDKTTSPRQSMRRRKARGLAFESDHLGTTGYSSSATRRLSVAKVYSIAGCMENTNVTACWNTGSDLNILREDEARRHGLEIDTSKVRSFKLPNKQTAKSIGQTFATFRFRDEQEGHKLRFEVVSNCPEDVILGLSFLRRTGTLLRKNAHRIQESSRICMQKGTRMLFVEDWHNEAQTNKSTMPFTVNGQQGNALPDSGSDIMAISGSYARRCGFDIDRTSRIEVLLADGTRMMTDGMVWDAALEFDPLMFADGWDVADYSEYMEGLRNVISSNRSGKGGFASTSVICDLHVIEDLPCDLILSTQFIMDNRALLRLHDDEMASAHNGAQDAEVLALRYGKNSWKRFLQIKLARKEGMFSRPGHA